MVKGRILFRVYCHHFFLCCVQAWGYAGLSRRGTSRPRRLRSQVRGRLFLRLLWGLLQCVDGRWWLAHVEFSSITDLADQKVVHCYRRLYYTIGMEQVHQYSMDAFQITPALSLPTVWSSVPQIQACFSMSVQPTSDGNIDSQFLATEYCR